MIDKKKVWINTMITWFWTGLAFFLTLVIAGLITWLAMRYMGHRAVLGIFTPIAVTMLFIFLISELIVILIMKGQIATKEEYPDFIDVVDELYKSKRPWWIIKPRLYIMKRLDVPNAMAFGWGFLGQGGVGITPALYKLLTKEELKGVVAHEIAHLMSRDVGLMSVVTILTSGIDKIRSTLMSGKTALGRGPFAFVFAAILWVVGNVIFKFLSAAISQEREISADARGASYLGSPEPLISALKKLESTFKKMNLKTDSKGVFDDIMISHPKMGERISSLRSIEVHETKLIEKKQEG